jgi:hypothetical protein
VTSIVVDLKQSHSLVEILQGTIARPITIRNTFCVWHTRIFVTLGKVVEIVCDGICSVLFHCIHKFSLAICV